MHNCPSGGRCFAEAARERASVADIVVVNTHLYGAHLASGGVVLPEHDVVVFDEAHELEEVMTSSLGVEVTPGRFRSLVTAARSLVEQRDAEPLESLASVGDQLGALLGDRVGTRGPARRRPAARGRPRAGRAARPRRRGQPARHRRAAPRRGAALVPGRGRRVRARPRPRQPQDAHPAGRRAPGGGPAPLRDARRRRDRLGRRDAAQRPPPPLPHRRGPRALDDALGRGHVGADQRDHPAADRRAGRARGLPHRGAQRGEPVRLPLPRAALRRPPPARPPRRGRRGGPARGARPADGGRRRAHPGPLHEQAGHRGGGGGAGARAPLHAAPPGRSARRTGCSRSSPPTRPPASSPRWASGRASTSPAGPCRS